MSRVFIEKTGLPKAIYYLVGIFTVPIMALFIYGIYQQTALNKPFGDQPMSDTGLIAFTTIFTVFCFGMIWLLSVIRLELRIADHQISFRFPPFINKTRSYRIADLEECKIVERRFITTGIGLRFDPVSKATIYSTGSRHFLSLKPQGKKLFMLSTKKPEEVQKAIEASKNPYDE